jgi:hypothetical protein
MECVPCVSVVVETDAVPEAPSVPDPIVVVPSRKATLPVGTGVLPVVPATVAVKLTDWPMLDGFGVDATVVVVATLGGVLTTWVSTAEVDAL